MEVARPNLTSYQKEILFSKSRFTITEASTKVGKTYSHIIWLYGKSHEFTDGEGKKYWWIAPVYSQSRIAFERFKRYLRKTGLYSFNESKMEIECPNRAKIQFKSADDVDNLFGDDVYGAVFDEAPRAKVEAWYALRTTLTATKAPCKLIGNYGGVSNWVHQLKNKALTDKEYAYFRITCWDAVKEGILDESEVWQAKQDLPEKIFKALYEAESTEDDGQLIKNISIEKIFSNTDVKGGRKFITADIARMGKDKTVIMVWDNFKVIEIAEILKSGIDEVVEKIKNLAKKYTVSFSNIICDEDGVGGGVVDFLHCKGFINNSKPKVMNGQIENFANLKTQCYYRFAERANRNEYFIHLKDDKVQTMISEELEQIRLSKEIDAKRITLKSKDEIKKEIGRSPDYSDALMMREWFELKTKITAMVA
jgi:hypothetical protein